MRFIEGRHLLLALILVSSLSGGSTVKKNFYEIAPTEESKKHIEHARISAIKVQPNSRIYYDYVENGKLTGGTIEADADMLRRSFQSVDAAEGSSRVSPPPFASTTLRRTGSSGNRIDLVIVGDGYTTAELGKFARDANRAQQFFFRDAFIREFANYFNVYRVDVVSNESGVDNDPSLGVQRDTALDMEFFCADIERLLCVNQDKTLNAANNAPAADQILVLGNSSKYGGAGYPGGKISTASSDNGGSLDIAVHEFGHTFGELADEYGGSGAYSGPEPIELNVSKLNSNQLKGQNRKWHRWVGRSGVGTFSGGGQFDSGLFRPTSNSKMRSLGRPWDAVNNELLIHKLYQSVRPVDSFFPSNGELRRDTEYSVSALKPNGRELAIQWWVDGKLVKSGTATFSGMELPQDNDGHTLAVRVFDPTEAVLDESARQRYMTFEHIWKTDALKPELDIGAGPETMLPAIMMLLDDNEGQLKK